MRKIGLECRARSARTVVLKLTTADFRILTRSLTPERWPASAEACAQLACDLRARVNLPAETRYRLAGVGLANFADAPAPAQADLFAAPGGGSIGAGDR